MNAPIPIQVFVFDAYGTLFDPHSIRMLAEDIFPGHGSALSQLWRSKQLEYSWLRALMSRYEDFWQLTEDALLYASESLKLELTAAKQQELMDAYLNLAVFPDVGPGLVALKKRGLRLAILSNGAPKMRNSSTPGQRFKPSNSTNGGASKWHSPCWSPLPGQCHPRS